LGVCQAFCRRAIPSSLGHRGRWLDQAVVGLPQECRESSRFPFDGAGDLVETLPPLGDFDRQRGDRGLELAREITARFNGEEAADAAGKAFVEQFSRGAEPEDMPECRLSASEADGIPLANLLREAGLTGSTSEALRLIDQGAVRIDGERISDRSLRIQSGTTHVYRVGKRRYARVTVA
jgi:ribosome-associated protein YbcJ (S4-like RNA binding protein)